MDKIWEEFLWPFVKKHGGLLAVVVGFLFVLWAHSNAATWAETKKLWAASSHYVAQRPVIGVGLGLACVAYGLWVALVRMSDHRYIETLSRPRKPLELSCEGYPCSVYLVERFSSVDRKFKHVVHVENVSKQLLSHVSGRMRLTVHDVRTQEIPFEVNHLEPGIRAVASPAAASEGLVSEYDAILTEVSSEAGIHRNKVLYGGAIGYNYTWLFNVWFKRAFWPRKRKYSLWWLRERARWDVWIRIKWFLFGTSRVYVGRKRRVFAPRLIAGTLGLLIMISVVFAWVGLAGYGSGVILWNIADGVYHVLVVRLKQTFK